MSSAHDYGPEMPRMERSCCWWVKHPTKSPHETDVRVLRDPGAWDVEVQRKDFGWTIGAASILHAAETPRVGTREASTA